ncbi:hypothetical protein ACFSHT_00985 [Paraburkholderia silviterrae]|uniref:Uncharacterized protein n=1 Tax=Paraburkholderia silviterrae TaxID=2528715 RepID=A0A4R5MFW9_9BURK|nr:hypothetical protein [Paraburkholderia silviterrae]TDG26188.1 hypothetical protein EYW47_02195 [Paraburkholderia silviterrae]
MTPERFHTLVEAYGADPRRWPEHERADALAWARAHRTEADAVLEEALALDAWLARDMIAPPSRALVEQIVALAPTPVPVHRAPSKRRVFWWSGAAFAGAGLAGALAGALTMSLVLLGNPPPSANDSGHDAAHESPSWMSTSFDGSIDEWGDE